MPKFRKKPVTIEAVQFTSPATDEDAAIAAIELAGWCRGALIRDALGPCIAIDTLEGTMLARPGDWIIKGVQGEFYPCKPDIFAATYEAAQ